jgi:hypothetical protein
MIKTAVIIAVLFIVPAIASANVVKELVGTYQMDEPGGAIFELRADGTASMSGVMTTWSAKGNQLSLGPSVMSYRLQGASLMLTMGPAQFVWKKIDGTNGGSLPMSSAQQGKKRTPAPAVPAAGGADLDEQAKQVLTSTAWCSFTYNKVSGTSTTRKVMFHRDGVMTVTGGAETFSSGYGGTHAGQSGTANAMKWKLDNLRLYVDRGKGYQDIGLTATTNSNGYVIIQAEGREYSMCK